MGRKQQIWNFRRRIRCWVRRLGHPRDGFCAAVDWFIPDQLRQDTNAAQRIRVSVACHIFGSPLGLLIGCQIYVSRGQLAADVVGYFALLSLFLINPFLYRGTQRPTWPSMLSVLELVAIVLYVMYFYGGGASFAVVWLSAVPVAGFLLIGRRFGAFAAALTISTLVVLLHIGNYGASFPALIAPHLIPELNLYIAVCGIAYAAFLSGAHEWVNHGARMGIVAEMAQRELIEQSLFEEKERAQVTLESIAEAVITTDAKGFVQYVNPVAAVLTGWRAHEAKGRPVEGVLDILNRHGRRQATNPVAQCLATGEVVCLAKNSLLMSRNGAKYFIQASAAPIRGREHNILGGVLVFRDITQTRRIAQKLAYQATHDGLTGLINRREFERRLARALAVANAHPGHPHALCYMDLDQFKLINDTVGHQAGDELLKQVARLIKGTLRPGDTLARLGGDEFSLLLKDCTLTEARALASNIIALVHDFRFVWAGRRFHLGVSIGLVPLNGRPQSTTELLSQADVACYTAKDLGRNRIHVYHRSDAVSGERHYEILRVTELGEALVEGRLRLYCQPIVPLVPTRDGSVRHEILLRVVGTRGELILPGAYIMAAERFGIMAAIDRWVVQTVLHDYAEPIAYTPDLQLCINLSGNSLSDESLLGFVCAAMDESGFPPERVCFEITETAVIRNLSQAAHFITVLKTYGCRFSLDDFGSGLCSFAYLKHLPVDYLKIDGRFVKDMMKDNADYAMAAAINQVGHLMGMETIAECVETECTKEQLRILGVDYVQGYAFGHPRPLEELTRAPFAGNLGSAKRLTCARL